MVKTSAVCTAALAWAGEMPRVNNAVVEISPNAIPSAPSTSWARNPTTTRATNSELIAHVSQFRAYDAIRRLRAGKLAL